MRFAVVLVLAGCVSSPSLEELQLELFECRSAGGDCTLQADAVSDEIEVQEARRAKRLEDSGPVCPDGYIAVTDGHSRDYSCEDRERMTEMLENMQW